MAIRIDMLEPQNAQLVLRQSWKAGEQADPIPDYYSDHDAHPFHLWLEEDKERYFLVREWTGGKEAPLLIGWLEPTPEGGIIRFKGQDSVELPQIGLSTEPLFPIEGLRVGFIALPDAMIPIDRQFVDLDI